MKKINFLVLCVVLLLLLNIGTLAFLFYRPGHEKKDDRHPSKDPAGFIISKLKLDTEQQNQFEQLRRKHHDSAKIMQDEDRRLHDAFFDLLKTDNPDKNKVNELADLVAAQQKTLAINAFDHFMQLRAICHDDQKKLFDENINEITKAVAQGRPPGPGDGPPGAGGPPPPKH
ncbi:MAG: periplasmic heavy metal sensor [Chitinophagaceae bacterium]